MNASLKWIVTLVALCHLHLATAQKGCQDVLYLKNGSIIRGMVTEMVPGGSIKIETTDGSVFVFTMEEVERMTKDAAAKEAPVAAGPIAGYQGIAEVGYGLGIEPYGADQFKFNFINGYRFNPRLMAGVGLGLRLFTGGDSTHTLIPIFLDGRWNILDRPVSPYVALSVGMAFNAEHDMNTEGLLLNSGLGAAFRLGGRMQLHAGLGGGPATADGVRAVHPFLRDPAPRTAGELRYHRHQRGLDLLMPLQAA